MRYDNNVIIGLYSMKGGEIMQALIAIITSVIANLVGHLICKWLDSKIKDDN